MKKSKFANINFESVEVLSREQMSKVKGGYGEGTVGTSCYNYWHARCMQHSYSACSGSSNFVACIDMVIAMAHAIQLPLAYAADKLKLN